MKTPSPTQRLTFCRLRGEDEQNLYHLLNDPEVMRFSTGPVARQEIPGLLKKALTAYAEARPSHYAILDRQTGDWLGACGFISFVDPLQQAPYEITYRLNPPCWNRGIATEAVTSLLDYGFTHFELPAIAAVVEEANVGSVRVLEKVGMVDTGLMLYHGIEVLRYVLKGH